MRRKTGMEKYISRLISRKKVTIAVIYLLCTTILLVQCNKEAPPGIETSAAETLAPSISGDIAGDPDSMPSPVGAQPSSETSGTPFPTEMPEPTATPTEGEKSAAISAQESSDSYISDPDDCIEAVQNEQMEGCVSLISAQEITHAVWEQLFPDTKFYALHLSNNNRTYGYATYYRLTARQGDRQYTAVIFDQLLYDNNISVTNENYELAAQAFALMTLNADFFSYQITFTDWEQIDMQRAFSHFDRRLQAWTELGGQEIQWYFGFENERVLEILGPDTALLGYEIGDYVPLPDFVDEGHSYATGLPSQYRFFFD